MEDFFSGDIGDRFVVLVLVFVFGSEVLVLVLVLDTKDLVLVLVSQVRVNVTGKETNREWHVRFICALYSVVQ